MHNLFKDFSSKDQQEWMNFIIETAGVGEQMENIEKVGIPVENGQCKKHIFICNLKHGLWIRIYIERIFLWHFQI